MGDAAGRVAVSLPEQPVTVRVDPDQIERVLANLINALKYSPETVPVRVAVTTWGQRGDRAGDRPRPASPPASWSRSLPRSSAGRQLPKLAGPDWDLAIARGFAEANGGRVWAESIAGQGATFVLALPAEAPVEAGV